MVSARESLRVAVSAEDTAGKFLELQQKQLELGALSPLDIYQAEQTYATRKLDVAQARFRLAQLEDTLRKQIGADLDPDARKMPIVLTETVDVPAETEAIDRDAMVQKAVATRPDLKGDDAESGHRRPLDSAGEELAAAQPGADRQLPDQRTRRRLLSEDERVQRRRAYLGRSPPSPVAWAML